MVVLITSLECGGVIVEAIHGCPIPNPLAGARSNSEHQSCRDLSTILFGNKIEMRILL
jgi:hypothetical protein